MEKNEIKLQELDDYERENSMLLPELYKNWIMANTDQSIDTRPPSYVFDSIKASKELKKIVNSPVAFSLMDPIYVMKHCNQII